MKRLIYAVAFMAALVACTQQEPDSRGFVTTQSNCVTASAGDFEDGNSTRTTITQSGSAAPAFAWKSGDVIGIIPMNNETVQSNYKVAEIGSDPKQALFDGGVWALKEGKSYAAYYPYQKEALVSGEKLEFSFLGQTQTANNSLEHIGAYDYMYANAVVPQGGMAQFNFRHLISLVRMQITVPQTDVYTALTLESSAAWFAGKAELSLANGTMTSTQSLKSCTIALDNISVNSGSVLTVWFATLPTSSLNGGSLTVKLYGKNTAGSTTVTGLNAFEAGKAYSYSSTATSSASDVEYVDLGLSVKWATCNLGANSPEEYGDYYAWGDIETYYEDGYAQESPQTHWKSGKSKGYTTANYRFYQKEIAETDIYDNDGFLIYKAGDVVASGYTKYVPKSYVEVGFKGFYDDKTVLDPEDDVAHVKLGGKWRMPTSRERKELMNECLWTWGSYKGVNGYKVTSNKDGYTDKWIFLPAAGYRSYTSLDDVGSCGDYWYSTRSTDGSGYNYYLYFDQYGVESSHFDGGLYTGRSIRPVSE